MERPPRDGLPVLMMADQKGKNMWYIINEAGERCKAVETEKEAIKLVANNDWYVDYIYSNESYMC